VVAEIEKLTVEDISPIVQSLVGDNPATPEPGWLVQATGEMSIGAGTLGILKVSGTAHVKGEVTPWSVVIKAMELEENWAIFSPEREIAAFRSGFFDKLDRGLKSVPRHGVTMTNSGTTLL